MLAAIDFPSDLLLGARTRTRAHARTRTRAHARTRTRARARARARTTGPV